MTAQSMAKHEGLCYSILVGPVSHHKLCKILGLDMVPSPVGIPPISYPCFNFLHSAYHHWTYLTYLCSCLPHSRSSVRAENYDHVIQQQNSAWHIRSAH